ncbi:hypothetical protein ACNPQK_01105 [Acinetobacter guillouiae]
MQNTISVEISLINGRGIDIARSNSISLKEVVNKVKVKDRLGLDD